MKISNETKVGVLTISALTILILGFNFLKGKDLFNQSKKIYAVFTDLGSLAKSNDVKINGYVIGKIYSLDAQDKNVNGIVATIALTKDVNIPKDSKAVISTPIIGSSILIIEKGKDASFLNAGDTLKTKVDNGILDDVKAQLTPTIGKVRNTLDTLNLVLGNINTVLNTEAKNNLQQTLANINKASNSLNGLLDNQNGTLAKMLSNANDVTVELKKNADNINKTITNTKTFSDKLAALELKPTIDSLNATVGLLKSVATKISSKDGSLGAFINDKTLFNKLSNTITSAETLIDDLRAHPTRYVNLSIFGKKDKGGYLTSPLPKKTDGTGNK